MRTKVLIIAFVLSLPFWWGVNNFAQNLEGFLYAQKNQPEPNFLAAQAGEVVLPSINEPKVKELDIEARAAISVKIKNDGSRQILYEQNSERPLPIASITKLVTALVVFDFDETYDFSTIIPISEKAVSQEGTSKFGPLKEGEKLTVEDLLCMALVESNNDAAYALTELISTEAFVDLMNLSSEKIGLQNTRFVNPTGLEPNDPEKPLNYSTAKDLVKVAEHIIEEHPGIFEITRNQDCEVKNLDGSIHHVISENTNDLLYTIPNIYGGKTGWAPAAQGCLLLVLEEEDGYTINVILGAYDRFEEMQKLINID